MSTKPQIALTVGIHKQQNVILVKFDYNQIIINHLKASTQAKWSTTMNCWYILTKDFKLNNVFMALKDLAFIDYSGLKKSPTTHTINDKPKLLLEVYM